MLWFEGILCIFIFLKVAMEIIRRHLHLFNRILLLKVFLWGYTFAEGKENFVKIFFEFFKARRVMWKPRSLKKKMYENREMFLHKVESFTLLLSFLVFYIPFLTYLHPQHISATIQS